MHPCAAGYILTYVTTLKLKLVSWKVVGLKATATRATFTARNPRQMKLKKYAPWSLNEKGHTER
jgi:hypothetical protein